MSSTATPVTVSGTRTASTAWWLGTGIAALLLLVAAVPTAAAVYEVPLLPAFLACTAQSGALLLALTRPRSATAVQFAASAVVALTAELAPGHLWPLTLPGLLTLVVHVAIVGIRHEWALAVGVWWTSAALCVGLVVLDPLSRDGHASGPTLIAYTVSSGLVLAAALLYRQRSQIRDELAAARRDTELEQSRRALVEERTRIARELHDVVAHSMSVIHMQATSARYRHPTMDSEMSEELSQIALAARGAMREMRQILTVLRDDDTAADTRPPPGLEELPALVERAVRAGTRSQLHMDPAVLTATIPQTVGVAVYRIAQEALSNVLRHAPGAAATIEIGWNEDHGVVTLAVDNERAVTDREHEPALEDTEGSGRIHLGLVGMHERAGLLGGSVQHGPTASGGFRVRARIPVPNARSTRSTSS